MAGLTARAPLPLRRAPFVALAIVALVAGLWGGLVLLGLRVSAPAAVGPSHGPLMALGFLGTLVSLERAVALGRAWAYAAPVAAATGALAVTAQAPGQTGVALLTAGGAVLLAAHVAVHRVQPSLHNAVMLLGAVAWVAATVLWLTGMELWRFVPLLAGFLVLTIVGERLELSRVVRLPRHARKALLGALAVFAAGLAVAPADPGTGVRIAGAGLVAQAVWLACFDVARRTVRARGVTRFMAAALLAGYGWLAAGGAIWLASGATGWGPAWDAGLHAVFLGFVMSMVFAHAPVIVPAVLRIPLPFHRRFYAHLALLHASLLLRVLGGDAAGSLRAWQWGGVLDEAAIVLFLGSTAAALAGARVRGRASGMLWRCSRSPTSPSRS